MHVGRQHWTSPLAPLCHAESSQFYIHDRFSKAHLTKYKSTIPSASDTIEIGIQNIDSQDSTNPTFLSLLVECYPDDMFKDREEDKA